MIPDYRVTIKIKNNYLFSAMRENGFKTVADLSRASGVSQCQVGMYLNLKITPFTTKGLRPSIVKIAKCLKKLPEDLFPPQHIKEPLLKNKATVEVTRGQVEQLISPEPSPLLQLEYAESRETIIKVLSSLTEKEKVILMDRYGMGESGREYTLRELGQRYNVGQERIRQIEVKALRKLRGTKCNRVKLRAAGEIFRSC